MARRYTLIHTALLEEAAPIIHYLGLKQFDIKPYRLFRGAGVLLVVSGVGRQATRDALSWICSRFKISKAINIGMAGCSEPTIELGTLVAVQGGPGNLPQLPRLPLKTVDEPVRDLTSLPPGINDFQFGIGEDEAQIGQSVLVDMEAAEFAAVLRGRLSTCNIHVLKVVSDHFEDTILKKKDIHRLIGGTLGKWAHIADDYVQKLAEVMNSHQAAVLDSEDAKAIRKAAMQFRFTHQEIKNLIDMAVDFAAWDEEPISARLRLKFNSRKDAYGAICKDWEKIKNTVKTYKGFIGTHHLADSDTHEVVEIDKPKLGFGRCPVASSKTRCCNLRTLDAVEGCTFDCSYCSIRFFYGGRQVGINRNLLDKLNAIEIDPQKTYHIGTGQSSDSLMLGNKFGILDALLSFAERHSNVILEFKTKSDNISHLLSREVPSNVICTWSINPQVVIDNEEHRTASLRRRIESARMMADAGNLIGFHFHPMVLYDDWQADYGHIIENLQADFRTDEVVMVSFGTLTFLKPVIKKIRAHPMKSRILQMPLNEIGGKFSYPLDIKRDLFRFAYRKFSSWHDKVFFYLCMEDPSLWGDVFGRDFEDNEEFEASMIEAYFTKVNRNAGQKNKSL